MENTKEIDLRIKEMASRIKELRQIEGVSVEDMAIKTDVSLEEYIKCENGEQDLNFAFLYRCANALSVNVTDIIEGFSPTLKSYALTRKDNGQIVGQAHGMTYYNLAYAFQNRIAEPLYVKLKYSKESEEKSIELTTHMGQECDIVVEGFLTVQVGNHKETLGPGDTIYYDSSTPHGMIAANGTDCIFYAIVLNPTGSPIPDVNSSRVEKVSNEKVVEDKKDRVYKKYIDVEENEKGLPTSIKFKNIDNFNFAFDIIDEIGEKDPNKLAIMHVGKDKQEKRITYKELSKESNRCANYFKSIGIKKGDRVMLILKRHYEYWYAILGLNKIGAVSIPATFQLQEHDLTYRFEAAGVSTILCTQDGDVANQVDLACEKYKGIKNKIIVHGEREGWRTFSDEYLMYSTHYAKPNDLPGGDDLMVMFFTSGTSGYPKIAAHNYKYALGHFHTAKYWHGVYADGLHFTISDTGWAKAMWGKLYGQLLAEGAIFVYDFDKFDAADILPLFKKYNITTFCAPPTMLRMMIKQDISKYDLSSVKHMTTAGEALNPEVYRQFEKATGLQIREGFGQSESTLMIGNLIGAPHKIGSMGKPVPLYNIKLVNDKGEEVADGETGEIVVDISKGSPCGLFTGYYKDEEKTNACMHDGLYHTGDTAWRDEDGYYWYIGRVDDVIKSSGYRIGPFEIESVIMELPYVLECGVSAAPDEVRGQVVKASIVLCKGTKPSDELIKEIQNYVKEHTAPYKYPRIVVFRDELPKTTSGKIIRNML